MKRLFLFLMLMLSSHAWACNYELRIVQRDATDSGSFTRQICPLNGGTQPSLMVQDPFTGQVQMGALVGFTWDGSTLTATGTQADWNATTGAAVILNKPTLSAVATTGAYSSLSGTPSLAAVATSGSYNDLSNKPTIPTVTAFNFSLPSTRALALSTSLQATDTSKAAIITPSYSCQNATTVLAASACTIQVRMGTGTLTCSTGTVIYTQSLTVQLGVLLTQSSVNPVPINLPIGASFILCPTAGTFTVAAVEQSAG